MSKEESLELLWGVAKELGDGGYCSVSLEYTHHVDGSEVKKFVMFVDRSGLIDGGIIGYGKDVWEVLRRFVEREREMVKQKVEEEVKDAKTI